MKRYMVKGDALADYLGHLDLSSANLTVIHKVCRLRCRLFLLEANHSRTTVERLMGDEHGKLNQGDRPKDAEYFH